MILKFKLKEKKFFYSLLNNTKLILLTTDENAHHALDFLLQGFGRIITCCNFYVNLSFLF